MSEKQRLNVNDEDSNTDDDIHVSPDKVMTNAQMQQVDNAIYHDQSKQGLDTRIIVLGAMNFLINAATSLIVPLFPHEMEKKGIGEVFQSLIFAVLPIGSVVAALYTGKNMLKLGRKRLMIIGLLISFATLGSYSIITFIPNRPIFISLCMILRIFQGFGRAMYSTVVFALVPVLWPQAVQKHIGILQSLTGLGVALGPILGGVLSKLGELMNPSDHDAAQTANLQYRLPFIILSLAFAVCIIPIVKIVPPDVLAENLDPDADLAKPKLPLGVLIKNRNIGMTCFASMMSCAGGTFFNAIMQTYLIQSFFGGEFNSNIPFIFGFLAFAYLLILGILPRFQKVIIYKFELSLGLLINCFGCLLLPPLPGEAQEWWTVIPGLLLLGISQGMAILPQIPELKMLIMNNNFTDDDIKASDMASGVFFAFYSAGILVGPLIQGIVTSILQEIYSGTPDTPQWYMYNFKWVCYIMGVIIFNSFIFYGLIGDGFSQGWVPQFQIFRGEIQSNREFMEQLQFNQIIQQRESIRQSIKQERANTLSQRADLIRSYSVSKDPNHLKQRLVD